MPKVQHAIPVGLLLACLAGLLSGCQGKPLLPRDITEGSRVSSTSFVKGPAPLRMPSPDQASGSDRFEDSLTGGDVFQMYCSSCHNRRPMSERPFANYRNVAAHMRTRANLTGKEFEKLVDWMRRVQDAPLPDPDTEPSPKRFTFSQPIAGLEPQREDNSGPPRDRQGGGLEK
jgi:hypothetical protein